MNSTIKPANGMSKEPEKSLAVYGGLMHGLYGVSGRSARVVMAAPSRRIFEEATGLDRDFISKTGNKAEIAAAMAHPGELVSGPDVGTRGQGDTYSVVPREKWHWKFREAEARRANTVTAAHVRLLVRVRNGGDLSLEASKENEVVERLQKLGLVEKTLHGLSLTPLATDVIERIGTRASVDVRSVAEEARRARSKEKTAKREAALNQIEDAREAVLQAARLASRQKGSIDAIFEAVDRLEKLEEAHSGDQDDEEEAGFSFGRWRKAGPDVYWRMEPLTLQGEGRVSAARKRSMRLGETR